MIDTKKYSFNKYSKKYDELFRREKNLLTKTFPKAKIEHIGSSSVKGLGGKGIIDIAISVQKNRLKQSIKDLQVIGYEYRPLAGDKERDFFRRIIKYRGKERRVHVHLTHHNSLSWRSMVSVRDYLRNHKDIVKEYASLKKEAVKYAKREGKRYRRYKENFLKKIERKALKEYSDSIS